MSDALRKAGWASYGLVRSDDGLLAAPDERPSPRSLEMSLTCVT